jgi:hypothetical protein
VFGRHLDKVSRSYWPGLFHCYNGSSLPILEKCEQFPRVI